MIIKIGKYNWTVKYVENKELPRSLGNTSFQYLTIKINKDQPKNLLKDTIFHETIHAYIKSYGFNKDYYYEEEVVCFITRNIKKIILLSNKIWRELY